MIAVLKACLWLFVLFYLLPLSLSALLYRIDGSGPGWRTADRSSAGILPPPNRHPAAVVRIFSARTVRWRGILASHSWIVFKPENATAYTRYLAGADPSEVGAAAAFDEEGYGFGEPDHYSDKVVGGAMLNSSRYFHRSATSGLVSPESPLFWRPEKIRSVSRSP